MSNIMTTKLAKTTEALLPPLLHVSFMRFIYFGGCKLGYAMTIQLVVGWGPVMEVDGLSFE
jgi:hypothetical protein